jgi:hypothetical protein
MNDAAHYKNVLLWVLYLAGAHYQGGSFNPEYMRALANIAADALIGRDAPDFEDARKRALERAREHAAELAEQFAEQLAEEAGEEAGGRCPPISVAAPRETARSMHEPCTPLRDPQASRTGPAQPPPPEGTPVDDAARYENALLWVRHLAGAHYQGGAFDPEHMRALANIAEDALIGREVPDFEDAGRRAVEQAREHAAELTAELAAQLADDEDEDDDDADDEDADGR